MLVSRWVPWQFFQRGFLFTNSNVFIIYPNPQSGECEVPGVHGLALRWSQLRQTGTEGVDVGGHLERGSSDLDGQRPDACIRILPMYHTFSMIWNQYGYIVIIYILDTIFSIVVHKCALLPELPEWWLNHGFIRLVWAGLRLWRRVKTRRSFKDMTGFLQFCLGEQQPVWILVGAWWPQLLGREGDILNGPSGLWWMFAWSRNSLEQTIASVGMTNESGILHELDKCFGLCRAGPRSIVSPEIPPMCKIGLSQRRSGTAKPTPTLQGFLS